MSIFFVLSPDSVAYIGPSVTGYKDQNFGYRIYTIDGAYEGTTSVSSTVVSVYTAQHGEVRVDMLLGN